MGEIIRVSIRREDPLSGKDSCLRTYEVETKRDMTVLEILQEIYSRLDPTLAYRRYRCGRRLCRSCEVKLDGKIVRGCATLLHPGETYLIEPAQPGSIIRDLVCDFDLH
jgi:succinate dehydrogenase/fumarate reductase-like Fe-S protein